LGNGDEYTILIIGDFVRLWETNEDIQCDGIGMVGESSIYKNSRIDEGPTATSTRKMIKNNYIVDFSGSAPCFFVTIQTIFYYVECGSY